MGIFGFGRKDKVIDLSERMRRQHEKVSQMREEIKDSNSHQDSQENSPGVFGFLGGLASASTSSAASNETSSENYFDMSGSADDKRKKLAKRLMDMTNKLEEISNQLYHLQQRIEVLERKAGVNGF